MADYICITKSVIDPWTEKVVSTILLSVFGLEAVALVAIATHGIIRADREFTRLRFQHVVVTLACYKHRLLQ